MTLTQLTYVVALASHGHFGRAAETCNVSQPTLSAQIKKLEEELGVVLFDRSYQPVRPTDHGEQIITQARVLLAERDNLFAMLEEDGPLSGELHIGVIPTLATYLLPLVTPTFSERYPQVELLVEEITTFSLAEAIAARRLDAGLVATEQSRQGIEQTPLFREAFVAYLGNDHELASSSSLRTEDLMDLPLWLLSEGHCLRDQVLQLCERANQPGQVGRYRVRFESGNLETLRHMVDRVGGATLLPELAVHYLDPESAEQIRPFDAPPPFRQVSIVSRRAGATDRLVRAFAAAVRDAIEPLLGPAEIQLSSR